MNQERGSALIVVVLVVFVLTMVGIAGVLYMTMEDRLSGNAKLTKEALYAAEIGLRKGESYIGTTCASGSPGITALLTGSTTYQAPGAGYLAYSLGTTYTNVSVPMPSGANVAATYSLYARNNIDDQAGSSQNTDVDSRVNLISVATVTDQMGRGITKVLEEQMFVGGAGGGERLMKGGNQGGTGAAGIGG